MRRAFGGSRGTISVDMLALPLLFCLLVAVVGVTVMQDVGSQACCQPEPTPDPRETSLRTMVEDAERLLSLQDPLERRVAFAIIRREIETATAEIAAFEEVIDLGDRIHQARVRLAEINRGIDALPRPQAPIAVNRPEDAGMGDYSGPFVLLECVSGRAIVYPGAWVIPMEPSDMELRKLITQIRAAGFVAVAVRPSGWYNNSFDKITAKLFKEFPVGGAVRRTVFPLNEGEPITPYLPG